jgi:hypothetical protein
MTTSTAALPELTDAQLDACPTWLQEGRDAYFDRDGALCPYDGDSIAGRMWEHGWMQARRDDRDARAMGL